MSRYFTSKVKGKDKYGSGSISGVDSFSVRSDSRSMFGADRGSDAGTAFSEGSGHGRAVRETKEWVIYEFGDYQKIQTFYHHQTGIATIVNNEAEHGVFLFSRKIERTWTKWAVQFTFDELFDDEDKKEILEAMICGAFGVMKNGDKTPPPSLDEILPPSGKIREYIISKSNGFFNYYIPYLSELDRGKVHFAKNWLDSNGYSFSEIERNYKSITLGTFEYPSAGHAYYFTSEKFGRIETPKYEDFSNPKTRLVIMPDGIMIIPKLERGQTITISS